MEHTHRHGKAHGPCVVQFGGQTAIKLTKHLDKAGCEDSGHAVPTAIDAAEDRERFDELLERCGIPRPQGTHGVSPAEEALAAGRTSWATRCCCVPPTCWADRT